MSDLVTTQQEPGFSLRPRNLSEAMELGKIMASSDMVPKDYRGKPGNILIAVQMGAELGLAPMQAIQNIAVINGRPAVWGDALLAMVQGHPHCDGIEEHVEGNVATCTVHRKGRPSVTRTFTEHDAKTAGLWGKQGPWSTYPQRMLQMRARSFALRDSFADVLRGMQTAEEVQDIPVDISVRNPVDQSPPALHPKIPGDVEQLLSEIYQCADMDALTALIPRCESLPQGTWRDQVRSAFVSIKSRLSPPKTTTDKVLDMVTAAAD